MLYSPVERISEIPLCDVCTGARVLVRVVCPESNLNPGGAVKLPHHDATTAQSTKSSELCSIPVDYHTVYSMRNMRV